MNQQKINILTNLDYPEYAHKAKKTRSHDLTLLDLSLSELGHVDKKIIKIIKNDLFKIGSYRLSQDPELLVSIEKHLGLPKKSTILTAGSDGALNLITELCVDEATEVIIPTPSFGRYEYHAKRNGGKIVYIDNSSFPYSLDSERILDKRTNKSNNLLILANPNNPTGELMSKSEIEKIVSNFKGVVVVDEALVINKAQSCFKLLKTHKNLVLIGSFSKIYGLAGMRIGYICTENTLLKSNLLKLVSPFEVSSLSLKLADEFLKDTSWKEKRDKEISKAIKILRSVKNPKIQITETSSVTAIIKNTKKESLYSKLLSHGIKTISGKNFRSLENENCVRVSIRDCKSMRILKKTLERI